MNPILRGLAPLSLLLAGLAHASPLPPTVSGVNAITHTATELKLAEAKRGTVVVFLSAKCPCSASHEQSLRKLATDYAAAGFRFVGVNSNADESEVLAKEHFARSALPFPVLRDTGAKLADAFGAYKTPHAFVVSAQGAVLFQGGVDDSHDAALAQKPYLREALEAISHDREPPRKEVRSLGCVIKRP